MVLWSVCLCPPPKNHVWDFWCPVWYKKKSEPWKKVLMWSCCHPSLRLPDFRTVRETFLWFVSYPGCSTLLLQSTNGPRQMAILPISSHGRRGKGALCDLFYEAIIPFMRALVLWSNHPSKALPPDAIIWGYSLEERTQTFRSWQWTGRIFISQVLRGGYFALSALGLRCKGVRTPPGMTPLDIFLWERLLQIAFW